MIGYLFIFGYCLAIACSSVFINNVGENFNPLLLLFYAALFSHLIFNLLNIKNIKSTHYLIIKYFNKWFIVAINMSACWIFSYISIVKTSASLTLILIPLISCIITFYKTKKYIKLLLVLIITLVVLATAQETKYFNFAFTVLAGIFFYQYFLTSNNFIKKHGISSIQILSIRSYILLIVLSIYLFVLNEFLLFNTLSTNLAYSVVIISLFNMIFPIILLHEGVKISGVNKMSTISVITPFIAFLIELLIDKNIFSVFCFLQIVLYLLIFIVININN